MDRINKVLIFWFGYLDEQTKIDASSKTYRKWFNSTPEIDQEIRDKFIKDLEEVARGNLDSWTTTARGCLALIVLFDQFSRNMYRGTFQAYQNDHMALKVCLFGLKQKMDQNLRLIERYFFYMPLMHSELLEVQQKSIELFQALAEESEARGDVNVKEFQKGLKYAQSYHAIIKRFGRFPHRNDILGRSSTPEEREFLISKQKA